MTMKIRDAVTPDAAQIAAIYNHYIEHTVVTFEESLVEANDMELRIIETEQQGLPWLVCEVENEVIGYAYASKWKGRCAYRYSVEVTVYLDAKRTAAGWGSKLYAALFARLTALDYHVAIAGISLPNPASIALHEKFGMHKVAHFEQVGFKFAEWVDVGYWQCQLSRPE
ncbi:hypothetical phosphinothricin N-acetyltransferase [Arenicella chitinivorans]|uniref:Hypothetical phosphinothricin N-acetyltransferase n=1 Tax=Arenicella chitinivorans TaxID=1329800 RepID=A0A918RVX5_9GAMM|nr:arsinothricin resistance N-acetyltransferase ArsN1 family B [Arenicella chitinivorans]GHA13212.1 hypothetical phosphinothricin N-acetyltransferase [Arenicella chitinivorans]